MEGKAKMWPGFFSCFFFGGGGGEGGVGMGSGGGLTPREILDLKLEEADQKAGDEWFL